MLPVGHDEAPAVPGMVLYRLLLYRLLPCRLALLGATRIGHGGQPPTETRWAIPSTEIR